VECLGDVDRSDCRNLVRQTLQADGTWCNENGLTWPFCADCDAAYVKRKAL
jgi:hypothetical protein